MGKDKHGKFIPPKGKPTGNGKEGTTGVSYMLEPDEIAKNLEISDKYMEDEDALPKGVHIMHPNRDTHKKSETIKYDADDTTPDKTRHDRMNKEHQQILADEISGRITPATFSMLSAHRSDCCITLYMPAHQSGQAVNEKEDIIRFKNLLQTAQKRMEEMNVEATKIQELLQPCYDLLRDDDFWREQLNGLAVFAADNFCHFMRVPATLCEEVFVNHHFLLTPLVPVLNAKNKFYLLVLSKHTARLYQADDFHIESLEVKGMPNGMADVVHFEEKDNEQLTRTGSSGGGEGANYHGMNSNPDHKTDIALYLEEVDRTLWTELLSDKHIPLLLAGVDYIMPIYKHQSKYQHIVEEALSGNFEHMTEANIHQLALEKMRPYFEQTLTRALNRYANHSADALTSSIIDDVVPAAYYGQVAQLFIQKDTHLWGRFDDFNNQLTVHDVEETGDDCLLNNIIIQTIQHKGDVFILDKEQMPAESILAASLRYA